RSWSSWSGGRGIRERPLGRGRGPRRCEAARGRRVLTVVAAHLPGGIAQVLSPRRRGEQSHCQRGRKVCAVTHNSNLQISNESPADGASRGEAQLPGLAGELPPNGEQQEQQAANARLLWLGGTSNQKSPQKHHEVAQSNPVERGRQVAKQSST